MSSEVRWGKVCCISNIFWNVSSEHMWPDRLYVFIYSSTFCSIVTAHLQSRDRRADRQETDKYFQFQQMLYMLC